ncbi:hypothetical protein [Kitasatospora sp. NPDC093806]|uniref:hypothetical protein n=1 Tax=Kitasatospora sp. NPDC093806 TaxID=3155075 RepID=UPI0034178AF9
MSTRRTHRSPARRVLAVCALSGAALLTAMSGGQAWADGAPAAPASASPNPSVSRAAEPAPQKPTDPQKPTAAPAQPGDPSAKVVVPPTATPSGAPAVAPKGGAMPSVAPERSPAVAPAPATGTGAPQVREVPKGAAKAGDGSGSTGNSGLMLAGGGTVAAVGAGAIGFALLRRRSGARG